MVDSTTLIVGGGVLAGAGIGLGIERAATPSQQAQARRFDKWKGDVERKVGVPTEFAENITPERRSEGLEAAAMAGGTAAFLGGMGLTMGVIDGELPRFTKAAAGLTAAGLACVAASVAGYELLS